MSDESTWAVGPGWLQLVRDLEETLSKYGIPYTTVQVKEKFGGLRYHARFPNANGSDVGSVVEEMQNLIERFETASTFICETCGMYGRPHFNRGGWVKTLCPPHREEWMGRRLLDA